MVTVTPLIRLRSFAFHGSLILWTLVLGAMSLPVLLAPRDLARRLVRVWSRCVFAQLRVLGGIGFEIRGRATLDAIEGGQPAPAILACKHQSAWETIVFLILLRKPAYILKRELLRIPIYGWFSRKQGMIAIDRSAGASALKTMVEDARRSVEAGCTVIIFPEGTRVPVGKHARFHPGLFALYRDLGLRVIPVAHNSGLFWRGFLKFPGTVVLELLPEIPVGLDRATFMKRVTDSVVAGTDRLVLESLGPDAPVENPCQAHPMARDVRSRSDQKA